MIRNTFLLLTILLSLLLISCGQPTNPMVSLAGSTMGTTYTVKYLNVSNADVANSPEQIQTKIDELLRHINQLMSTYIPDSELSLLNKAEAEVPFIISEETEFVITEALKLFALSDGMLDVTVGPLVNLWGFGPKQRPTKIPSQSQLEEILSFVGVNQFTMESNTVVKHHESVYIDLSTIAKGYAVDEIADLLESYGIANYLVEIGGEMRVAGTKENQQSWLIAIEKPIAGERAVQQIVSIGNNAIATSGDYRNYFEDGGVRYSHLINPKTGYPIKHNLVAVTVVAPESLVADGLATALNVMGSEAGIKLAEKESIAALFITKSGDEFNEYQSTRFKEIVKVLDLESKN